MKGFYSVRKNKCIHTNSFSSVGQSIITLLYFTFPICSIALVRFQEATFPPFTCLLNQKLLTIECSPKIFTKTETKCVF